MALNEGSTVAYLTQLSKVGFVTVSKFDDLDTLVDLPVYMGEYSNGQTSYLADGASLELDDLLDLFHYETLAEFDRTEKEGYKREYGKPYPAHWADIFSNRPQALIEYLCPVFLYQSEV